MFRSMIFALVMSLSFAANAQWEATETLHDVLSPDEVAAELGLEIPAESIEDLMVPMSSRPSFASQANTLLRYFPVVIVVNKAAKGATAQRAQVYVDGILMLDTKVSTGREKQENAKSGKKYFSATPVGWFSPTWQSRNHFSNTWQAEMPWTTFFHGGIAFHAALPAYYKQLGSRASGGCIRMLPQEAQYVFDLVKFYGKGRVPAFTRHGGLKRDRNGDVVMTNGWNTLIIVEDRAN